MADRRIVMKSVLSMMLFKAALISDNIYAQDFKTEPLTGTPYFYAEVFNYESSQQGRGYVEIFTKIPYSEINFVKDGDQYIGRIEISAAIIGQDKQQVWQKSQSIELNLKDFSRTVSSHLSCIKQFSADLVPGQFILDMQISDQSSKKSARCERAFTVRDVKSDSLALSDLMFVNQVSNEGERKNIVPNMTSSYSNKSEKINVFFEVYNGAQLDSVHLICKFVNSKEQVVAHRVRDEMLTGNRTQIIWQIDTMSLSAGRYTLVIEASANSKFKPGSLFNASASRNCSFRIENFPMTITDIDKAVDQLIYVAKGDELDHIKEAETSEEKVNRFMQFWAKHDPDPKTVKNELMEEYYTRIDYANRNFVSYTEGWRTDRGMVFVKFGPPQNIDRHPFDANSKPYEVWYYYELNRQFVFIDDTGFGDYRLRYPETDLWGRMR
jgi:GWxTD domain-containing protein